MKETKLTREQLYEMVWKEPLTSIVKRYHISYTELRKVYHDLNIPIPEGGYWSKLRWGKKVEKVKLTEDYTGKQEINLKEMEPNDPIPQQFLSSSSSEEQGIEEIFKVPLRLTNPDILIINTKEYFDAVHRHDWRSREKYPERKDVLSIDVQYVNLSRALRIFDTIIKILRSKGHDISFGWKGTEAVIYGQEVGMRLREINKVSDKPRDNYSSRDVVPTGKLTLQIGNYEVKTVSDGRKLIEDKIDTIIYKLEAEAKQWYDWHVESEIREKERQEQLRIEQEARARKEKELSDFKSLFVLANRLHQANIMRNYLSLVEANTHKNGLYTEEFKKWAEWTRRKIEWYDPLISSADETFTEEDKKKIFQDLLQLPISTY